MKGKEERVREGKREGRREGKKEPRERKERQRGESEIWRMKTERGGVRRDDAYATLLNE
jgi:hypothetical protein